MRRYLILLFTLIGATIFCFGQSEPTGLDKVLAFPGKLSKELTAQQASFSSRVDRQTDRYLQKLLRQEKKLQKKLRHNDSALVASLNLGSDSLYQSWKQTLSPEASVKQKLPAYYSGKLDSMTTALNFLEKNPLLAKMQGPEIEKLKSQYQQIGGQLDQVDHLKQLVQERKALLKEKLANLPLGRAWSRYQKQAIYYQQQLEEYKQALQDPSKMEKKALEILAQVPAFRKFFDKYSVLGSMFRLPGQVEDMDPTALLTGLQTRDAVLANITQRMGSPAGAQQAITAGMQQGQAELSAMKAKMEKALAGGESPDMPGFKPNQQKSRSFLQRLELGTNVQSTQSNTYWPYTSDLGMSLGYKVNNRSVIGVGASYKIGWGQDIKHIQITHQGIGLRSFMDVKIRKGFWLTGGGEWNYRNQFQNLGILKDFSIWQQSVLMGLQKKQQAGKYKATFSILYDALWNQHIPSSQPVLFRVGYNFR